MGLLVGMGGKRTENAPFADNGLDGIWRTSCLFGMGTLMSIWYSRSRMHAITICCIVIFNKSLVRCHVLNLYTVTLYCYLTKSSPSPTASCCFPVITSHETSPVLPSIIYRHHNLFLRHTQTLHSPATTKRSNDRQAVNATTQSCHHLNEGGEVPTLARM
jgi:hypothetical protein